MPSSAAPTAARRMSSREPGNYVARGLNDACAGWDTQRPRDPHRADGHVDVAAGRAGGTGDADRHLRGAMRECADGHFACGRFADGAPACKR